MHKICLHTSIEVVTAAPHFCRQMVFAVFMIVLGMTSAHAKQIEGPHSEGYGLTDGTAYTVDPHAGISLRDGAQTLWIPGPQRSDYYPMGEKLMSTDDRNTQIEERMTLAKNFFVKNPQMVTQEHQGMILKQRVVLRMTPFESYLAAGEFAYKVVADQSKWPTGYDPYKVLWAQTSEPDDSEIWMTFQTGTQFSELGIRTFRVHFQRGKAVDIQMLDDEKRGG